MMAALTSGLERARHTHRDIVRAAREKFAGPVTYAAGMWETVDWELFDLVSVDAYHDADNAAGYRDALRAYRRFGKPVAVTGLGCCTYRGAASRGGMGWMIFDEKSDPPVIPLASLLRVHAVPQATSGSGRPMNAWTGPATMSTPCGSPSIPDPDGLICGGRSAPHHRADGVSWMPVGVLYCEGWDPVTRVGSLPGHPGARVFRDVDRRHGEVLLAVFPALAALAAYSFAVVDQALRAHAPVLCGEGRRAGLHSSGWPTSCPARGASLAHLVRPAGWSRLGAARVAGAPVSRICGGQPGG